MTSTSTASTSRRTSTSSPTRSPVASTARRATASRGFVSRRRGARRARPPDLVPARRPRPRHLPARSLRLREGAGLAAITDEVRRTYASRFASCRCRKPPVHYVLLRGGRRVHFESTSRATAHRTKWKPSTSLLRGQPARRRRDRSDPRCDVISCVRAIRSSRSDDHRGARCARSDRRGARARGRGVAIIGGAPVKGPAIGCCAASASKSPRAASRVSIATGCALRDGPARRRQRADVEALGLAVRVTDTVMRNADAAANLASEALQLASD